MMEPGKTKWIKDITRKNTLFIIIDKYLYDFFHRRTRRYTRDRHCVKIENFRDDTLAVPIMKQ